MKQVTPEVDFKKLDEDILAAWESHKTFHKQNENRKDAPEFCFNDGPPFANGLPHYGHLLANTIKDVVPRYWIMKGFHVDRRFGWDCHGLPVEFEIEKKHELKGRPDILKLGVDKFNEMCRESVLHYTKEWQKVITRMGRWVDWDNQYRTMDKTFMESVWWVFSEIFDKGLVYQDFKVVPYSPRTSSVVSNFEANQNYKQTQDPSIVVKFHNKQDDSKFLVWTTTPWTLISNLALSVSEDIDYVKVKDLASDEIWILGKARLDFVYPKKKKSKEKAYEILEEFKGKDLVGLSYEPIFPYFAGHENAFKVFAADFVSTEDGTGIVHQSPAYGEDDFAVCKANNIKLVDPIDDNGCFTDTIPEIKGQYFKDADKAILKMLKEKGVLVKQDTLVHSYPFDERTNTPLMYKAVPSWYVAVEKLVPKLVANNQKINWVPGHIKDGRMGTWLEGARDWAISRNRFWGTPIPVWVCDQHKEHIEVFGSVAQLEERSGKKIDDIHQHFVNKITFKCPHCSGTMKVVDAVFDCWFESGSMPYAQLHYPFENKEKMKDVFPADFISEGLDQTRGWFYTLSVLSAALFDKPAFKNVIVNGIILDESGKKMSKRHRNYTPPQELLDKYGADSVRLYMLNSPLLRAEDLIFTDQGVRDIIRQVLLPLWNAYSFLSTYAHADGWKPSEELKEGKAPKLSHEYDRWIVSKYQTLVVNIEEHMKAYKLYLVVPEVLSFVEDLTNWYIRLNRRRFWGEGESGNQDAYSTLYYILLQFSKVFAPFAPFLSDRLYKNLMDDQNGELSVHLCDMPKSDKSLIDEDLEAKMKLVHLTISQGRFLRQKYKIKIRQPLASMVVVVRSEKYRKLLEEADATLKAELNLKNVIYTTKESDYVRLEVKPNLKTLGRKLGKQLNDLRKELNSLNEKQDTVVGLLAKLDEEKKVTVLGHELTEEDFLISRGPLDNRTISTDSGVTVLLETELTEELMLEGLSREVVNRIQNLRKASGLQVSDRIHLELVASDKLAQAIQTHREYIVSETLALDLKLLDELSFSDREAYDIEGHSCQAALSKA